MPQIDRFLEGCDLSEVHTALTLVGFFLALYVMSLTSHVEEDHDDPWLLRKLRRLGLAGQALAFLWSLSFSLKMHWQPWPPELALILTVIVALTVRAVAIHARLYREGQRKARVLTSRKIVARN